MFDINPCVVKVYVNSVFGFNQFYKCSQVASNSQFIIKQKKAYKQKKGNCEQKKLKSLMFFTIIRIR